MSAELPKIDSRKAADITSDLEMLLAKSTPELQVRGQLPQALINIFGRFAEIVIDRLNKAPEKNFLAFLNLLGVSPRPPQPARVPLTFYLSTEGVGHAVVPAGTQVAAELAKGERDPIVFETERELPVTSVKLASLILRDAEHDRYVHYDSIVPQALPRPGVSSAGTPLSAEMSAASSAKDAKLIPHVLYVGFEMYPHWPPHNQLTLVFDVNKPASNPSDQGKLQWEICTFGSSDDVVSTLLLTPAIDETGNLTKSGRVVFENVPPVFRVAVDGLSNHWIRCCLMTPITRSSSAKEGMVRASQLPMVKTLSVRTQLERKSVEIDQVFANNSALDVTKDFLPFGEGPRFGDTLYFASSEGFSNPDASVTCNITLTNPAPGGPDVPIPPVVSRKVKLRWEFWDGQRWTELGTSDDTPTEARGRVRILDDKTPPVILDDKTPPLEQPTFSDTTRALSVSGKVRFAFSRPPVALEVNGFRSYWIRARIISGNYGEEAHYELDLDTGAYVFKPATFAPPSIQSISIDYNVDKNRRPGAILSYNDFAYQLNNVGKPFAPFLPATDDAPPALYFGFALPGGSSTAALADLTGVQAHRRPVTRKFPNRSMSLFVGLAERAHVTTHTTQPVIAWEYWNGSTWKKWTVRDDTTGLQRSGLIRVLAPPDFSARKEFALHRYWLRMRQSQANFEPQLKLVVLNTTMAMQGITINREILGASNGRPDQTFKTTHSPVLEKQQLEVREPTMPSSEEKRAITEEEGDDAIRRVDDTEGKMSEVWVRWHEVPNFNGSRSRDRHYVLDRASGQISFGDGTYGLIPHVLPGNICMARYHTGGGKAGNKPAFTVKQLKTAVPYIDKVINWEQASGGSDLESTEELLHRGPRMIRHRDRAVTVEDFEDLALLASTGVARAKCAPLFDLASDPDSQHRKPGIASVIVVPNSTSPQPIPNVELLNQVRGHLEASCPVALAQSKLILLGPEYISIDVNVEITVEDPDTVNEIELAVTLALDGFLHPLNGGSDGHGWDFGRLPQRSDLFALIEGIPGVNHVRQLQIRMRADRDGTEKTSYFLICCGRHEVVAVVED